MTNLRIGTRILLGFALIVLLMIALGWYEVGLAGPWGAIGRLQGDTLRVTYNDVMHFSDFLDGAYVRVP